MEVLPVETVGEFIHVRLRDEDPAIVEHSLYARCGPGCYRRLLSFQRMPTAGTIAGNIEQVLDRKGPASNQALRTVGLRHKWIVDKGAKWVNLGHGSGSPLVTCCARLAGECERARRKVLCRTFPRHPGARARTSASAHSSRLDARRRHMPCA